MLFFKSNKFKLILRMRAINTHQQTSFCVICHKQEGVSNKNGKKQLGWILLQYDNQKHILYRL